MPRIFSQRSPSTSLALIALVAITLALPGCGRRGALEAPPDATGASASKPQSANRLTPGIGGASRQNVANRDPLAPTTRAGDEEDEPPVPAPNRPFILDAIL